MTPIHQRSYSCSSYHCCRLIAVAALVCSAAQAGVAAATVGELQLPAPKGGSMLQRAQVLGAAHRALQQSVDSNSKESQPELAAAYMDSLLARPESARERLCGNFTKRSKVAVVYMCFERMEMIERAIPAILRSDGLQDFDFFISQDGGADSIFHNEMFRMPDGTQYVYIRHPANLCAGLHHYFVKAFAFDIMDYDTLIVIEEDNVVHQQALQLLVRMAELSLSQPSIGAVSLLDMDVSAFLDAGRFSGGIIPTAGATGHLWVFGLARAKYDAARRDLRDYYETIKGHDYRTKHEPPLRDAIEALMRAKGFPMHNELSQDRWFVNSLAKAGFTQRYQTLFRFFEPIGHYGLHFNLNESTFYGTFGRQMFAGRIEPAAAFDVTADPRHTEAIRAVVQERLTDLCSRYSGNEVLPEGLANSIFTRLLDGRLNGLEVVRDLIKSCN